MGDGLVMCALDMASKPGDQHHPFFGAVHLFDDIDRAGFLAVRALKPIVPAKPQQPLAR